MIKSGEFFLSGRTGGVIGAVVPWRGAYAGIAPAHIFHYSGTDSLRVGNQNCRIAFIPGDADLAFFPILAACKPTELGKPHLGEVTLENAARKRSCRISDVSWSIAYVVLPPGDLPGPGDSGTPLVQDGKVVGMLLSFNMHTYKGIAISAEMIKEVAGRRDLGMHDQEIRLISKKRRLGFKRIWRHSLGQGKQSSSDLAGTTAHAFGQFNRGIRFIHSKPEAAFAGKNAK